MRVVAILFFFMSSAIQAQTIEERLPECIEEAEELLLKGTRVRAALASEVDEDNIDNILEVMFAREIIDMFNGLIEQHIEKDATASELQNNLEKVANPMGNRFDYIADMMLEHWENRGNSAKARFIAGCANNFDGKAETQAKEIAALQAESAALQKKLMQYENQLNLQKDKIFSLENRISKQRENELRLRTEVITLQRELTELNKKNEQLETTAQLADVYRDKFSKLLSRSNGAKFVEELVLMSAFDRNVALRDSKIGDPEVQRAGFLGGCIRRLRDQAQASVACKSAIAEFLESETN